MKKFMYGIFLIVLLTGCVTIISPGKSKMYFVQGAEFELNARQSDRVNYFVVLGVKEPAGVPRYLEVEFQDPCKSKQPIKKIVTIPIKEDKVLLRSPALDCLQSRRYYKVIIKTYSDAQRKNLVDTLIHKVYSLIDSGKLSKDFGKEIMYYAP